MTNNDRDQVLHSLHSLIQQARREGKWLRCFYQNLWFTPDELEAEHANGKFIWGAVNWELRDPMDCLRQASDKTVSAQQEEARIRAKLNQ